MKKKVGLLTINDYGNYGNRLQNFALQEVIKGLGFEVETVVNNSNTLPSDGSIIKKLKGKNIKDIFNKVNERAIHKRYSNNTHNRIKAFKSFTKLHIKETDFVINKNHIPEDLNSKFDYFITGSDQVWNPIIDHRSSIDFLTFAEFHKRISYAPSFGVSNVPSEREEEYKTWLNGVNHISVREDAGASIIKQLTGKEASVLIDPTLLLDESSWDMLINSSNIDQQGKKGTLVTYFLGDIPKEYSLMINDIALKYNLDVINLGNIKDADTYTKDPAQFLRLIEQSELVCTDSFHGSVFSIVLEKPFIVFDRNGSLPSMNSRIETLLNTFKLEDRYYKAIQPNNVFNLDFKESKKILQIEREKALNFLKKALNV
ncbi:Polysaccharide pyruvyl transferase [Terribacillus aidingensis]|uniref:Polysaccharide pyruvyl transferase n=1 Tax=Terribacillus aidingensis TaxID=586416 RepID=A0A285NA21_9BACI|nr:polysaccharide pyruvyl transferase family protein [Terribacillus aidingensis]SNZ04786.1 Polysaccharide pyruvyl transferase [Terribacillus aidingensis]